MNKIIQLETRAQLETAIREGLNSANYIKQYVYQVHQDKWRQQWEREQLKKRHSAELENGDLGKAL